MVFVFFSILNYKPHERNRAVAGEAGKVKTDGGAVRTKNGRPMLQNGKSKVDY